MSSSFYDIDINAMELSTPTKHQEEQVQRQSVTTTTTPAKDENKSISTEHPPDVVAFHDGFFARQSRRVARRPCVHLLICLVVSIGLSVLAMTVGDFSVSANSGGWQSRGTLIADRQTQLMITEFHQEELFQGDDAIWEQLLNNVLPGWEDDDDTSDRRRSLLAYHNDNKIPIDGSVVDLLRPMADRIEFGTTRELPFELTPMLRRELQANIDERGCDMSWYRETNLTQDVHLWPIWKTESQSQSVLEPNVLRDICKAEAKTQEYLEAHNLCFGCEIGCLPPYSLVMFARLMVDNGWTLSCDDLANAWAPLQADIETELSACVTDIKKTYDPSLEYLSLPASCPPYFYTTMVANDLDTRQGKSQYTSSIFATHWSDINTLYDAVDHFDTAESSPLVQAAYDTQYEDFVGLYLDDSLGSDMALAMGSAAVVAIAIFLHTRSPFITLIGLLQIILSFPLSYLVYKLIAGLNFFPFLNFIGIFVVFALGAGDIFVAVDKWKNARLAWPSATTEEIAALALPDAAMAMFLTTFTTAVAFFATAICPVAPIKMFAIFCGLLVTFDYIMNVLMIFPALCIYDRSIQAKGVQGVSWVMNLSCCRRLQTDPATRKHVPKDVTTRVDEDDLEATTITTGTSASRRNNSTQNSSCEGEDDCKPSLIQKLLSLFYDLLHAARWPLLVACMAALGVSIYVASTLELPTSSDVRLLDDSSQFEQNYLWRQHLLSTTLEKAGGSQAYVIWGVTAADTGDQNDPGTWSELVLDNTFDSSPEESQIFLRDFCESMFTEDFADPLDSNYTCPLTRFENWLAQQSIAATLDLDPNPVYIQNCNNATGIPMNPANWDACVIGWSKDVGEVSILSRQDKVKIMSIPFASRVRYDDYYDTLDDEWNLIENWVNDKNAKAPRGVKQGFFSSFDFWWYDTNGQMLAAAYSSAGIALGCAAAVILFSSQSFVLTFFCTLTIGYVLTSVTATLVAMGWTLGFLESICFAILIGVSVDFVIHLGHAYSTAAEGDADRSFRARHALISMGPSILATGFTTILSAVVMLFTVITFFQKFALILVFTVLQASIGSFFVFLTMADCFGPRNPTYLWDKVQRLCSRK